MIKKDLVNKKVVRAIALGLSAVMLTTPMTALADGAGETDVTGGGPENTGSETEEQMEIPEEYTDAADSVNAAEVLGDVADFVVKVQDGLLDGDIDTEVNVTEVKDVPGYHTATIGGNEKFVDRDKEVADPKNPDGIDEVTYEHSESDITNDITNKVSSAESNLDEAADKIDEEIADLAVADSEAKEAAGNVATAKVEAAGLADALDDAYTDLIDAVSDALQASEDAKNVATKEEAQAILDSASNALDVAKEAQANAQKAVEGKQAELDELNTKVLQAEAVLVAAQTAVDVSADEVEAAAKALSEAEAALETIQGELEAAKNSLEKSKEIKLLTAYEKMQAAAAIANKFNKNNFDEYDGKAGDEYTSKFGEEKAPLDYWNASKEYFQLYIQSLYDNREGEVKYEWYGIFSDDSEKENTYKVTYMEDGEEKVAYYNYHLTNDETGDITIYKKDWLNEKKEADGYKDAGGNAVELDGTEKTFKNRRDKYVVLDTIGKLPEGATLDDDWKFDKDGNIVVNYKKITTKQTSTVTKSGYSSRKKADEECRRELDRLAKELGLKKQYYSDSGYKNVSIHINPDGMGGFKYTINLPNGKTVPVTTTETGSIKYKVSKVEKLTFEDPDKKCWYEKRYTDADATIEGLRTKAEELKALEEDVADKKKAADLAQKVVENARKAAEEALNKLKNLLGDSTAKEAVEQAKKDYEAANADLAKAIEDAADADEKVRKAEEELGNAQEEIDEYFKPDLPNEEGGNDITGGEDPIGDGGVAGGDDTTSTTPVVVPVVAPEEIPTATVTPVAGGAGAAQNLVDIDDEDTPLAAGIDNADGNGDANGGDGDDVLVAGAEEDVEPAIVAIEDEETPLAAGSGADGKMSWWWLLIVALLGATGYKMYKDHQKKKEEAAQEA